MPRCPTLTALLCASLVPALAGAQAPAPRGGGAGPQDRRDARAIEERVSDLRERVFRSKSRLTSLQELVLGGDPAAGSRVVLVHRNEMGSGFYLESATYLLDGAPIYTKVDVDGDLERREEIEIFDGRIPPGSHRLAVQLVYRGNARGLFTYVSDYRFKVQSSYAFQAEAGSVSTIRAVGHERGGLTAELQDRPSIRYDVDVEREEPARPAAPAAGGARP